jgi:hypothetical protein
LNAEIFPKVGTASLQFLKLGVDARAIGMGEAYVPVTDDISSVFWNPAGLAYTTGTQSFISHTNWPAEIYHEYIAASYQSGISTFALSGSYLHMSSIEETDAETFGPNGLKFNPYDLAIGFTYAVAWTSQFNFGFTAKYLREDLYDGIAVDSYALDIGSLYNTGWKNLKIGMCLRNFGPDVKFTVDNDGDGKEDEDPFDLLDNDNDGLIDEDKEELGYKIPLNFSLGASMELFNEDNSYLLASAQLDNVVDRDETWNAGIEYKLSVLFLRGGYQFNYDSNSFTAGFGVMIPTALAVYHIDYAYTDMGYLTEDFIHGAHRVSLKMKF